MPELTPHRKNLKKQNTDNFLVKFGTASKAVTISTQITEVTQKKLQENRPRITITTTADTWHGTVNVDI